MEKKKTLNVMLPKKQPSVTFYQPNLRQEMRRSKDLHNQSGTLLIQPHQQISILMEKEVQINPNTRNAAADQLLQSKIQFTTQNSDEPHTLYSVETRNYITEPTYGTPSQSDILMPKINREKRYNREIYATVIKTEVS